MSMLSLLYATYIIKGEKAFSQVPSLLKPQVKQILEDLEMGHLAN